MRQSILGMILAGGEGTRLAPLTTKRAKPAVPFGGKYRIIDFVLSNFVNSGILSTFVITQFRSQSLSEHIINGWNISSLIKGQFIVPVPAQMQSDNKRWYTGTADAIWQNLHLVNDFQPELLAVFGGDHIYKMDISQMAKFHTEKESLATIAAIPVPISEGNRFGIIQVDENWRITGFQEKPEDPTPMPGNPDYCLASMGNYIFNSKWITGVLNEDAKDPDSSHDFGNDILPHAVETGRLYAYNFYDNKIVGALKHKEPYWRDVGTIQSYYEANMDLRMADPQLNLYSDTWPIHTYNTPLPPAKFVHNEEIGFQGKARIGKAINSTICDGCIVSGSTVLNSILSPEVHVHSYSTVCDSILMNHVDIRENCQIRNAIIDKHVVLEPGTQIGYDREKDAAKFKVVDLDEKAGTWLTIIEKNHNKVNDKMMASHLDF
ncbi:MAG: glucose-1-phosphate adenylyltransferase [Lentisphaeraceae bacterium]|nr:glucose-1-phosphate adenylyltransferase [Lentisphaeraceae bacterium]